MVVLLLGAVTALFALLQVHDAFAQPGPVADSGSLSAYRLIGTIGGNALAGAVLSDGKGEQTFIRLNDRLPDGSQLVGVHLDRISIKGTDGTRYDMYISHETKPSSPTPIKPVAEARPAPPVDPYTGNVAPTAPAGHPVTMPGKRGRVGRTGSNAE